MKFRKILMGVMLSLGVLSIFSFGKVNAVSDGIIDIGSGKECLYGKFDTVSGATSYDAYVKKSTDSEYTKLDSQLVRESSSLVRIDAVGLSKGKYCLKFVPKNGNAEITNSIIEVSNINVEADDRSGYAHFNYSSGVGAYNDDGTLKDNAVVVYVNDDNKNTVTASMYNAKDDVREIKTGLANILKAQSNSNEPLDIRIIGTVCAATWSEIEYDPSGTYRTNKNLPTENVIGVNDRVLKDDSHWEDNSQMDESTILEKGYNTLNINTNYSKLNGLTNKIKKESDGSFDSYFNMLDISGASNVTVEGIGTDSMIFQWGLTWKSCNSIEVKNITFDDYPEDACSFEASANSISKDATSYDIGSLSSANAWVHNCTFNEGKNYWDVCTEQDKHEGDGATDIKKQKNYTLSYNHYYKNHKTGLVGGGNGDPTFNVTFHHNWYQQNQSRMPYARQANIHMYNNYYDNSKNLTMQIYSGTYAFIEYCYFENDNKRFEIKSNGYQTPAIKSFNNFFDGGTMNNDPSIVTDREDTVSNGNLCSSSFDTDSTKTKFYYDSSNKKSDVTNLITDLQKVKTDVPNLSGAGIMNTTTYSVVGEEPEEDTNVSYDNKSVAIIVDDDFSNSSRTIEELSSSSIPTSAGLYQYTNISPVNYTNNNIQFNNNGLFIYDNSEKSTIGYYIFGNSYSTKGVYKYSVTLTTSDSVGSKWNFLQFITTGDDLFVRSCGEDKTNKPGDVNKLGYKIGSESEVASSNSIVADSEYRIVVTVDYDKNSTKIEIDNDSFDNKIVFNVSSYAPSIKGLRFNTADTALRSYYINSVSIEREDNITKLGYQFGKYTSNDVEYKALRIVGKFDSSDYIGELSDIASIEVNIDLVNNNSVTYKSVTQKITDVYKSLELSNGTTIAPAEGNVRYYYVVIKGITSANNGYKINATTTITLKNGTVINCSGFSYTINN